MDTSQRAIENAVTMLFMDNDLYRGLMMDLLATYSTSTPILASHKHGGILIILGTTPFIFVMLISAGCLNTALLQTIPSVEKKQFVFGGQSI